MIASLGTLVFLATLWLLVVVGAAILEESGASIAAALKGKPAHEPMIATPAARARMRRHVDQPIRVVAGLRAAA